MDLGSDEMARNYRSQNDYEKEFVSIIDKLCYSRQRWQVWEDLISAMACSISNVVDRTPERLKQRVKELDAAVDRLGGTDIAGRAFDIVVEALEHNPDQDFLGAMYMQLELGNHWTGQFFTPYCVSKMMAQITMGELKKQVEQKGWVSICDPCIGGGAMLMAAANTAKEMGVNYQNHMLFVGQDIDRIVGMMAYIQLSLLGCPGYIVIADSITNPMKGDPLIPFEKEGQEFWYTPFYFSDTWNFRKIFKKMERMINQVPKPEPQRKEQYFMFFDFHEQEESR
jgi:type I restriction-modification system DNA methylase subunit